jgi:hypothetical protein
MPYASVQGKWTIQAIRSASASGQLEPEFLSSNVNDALGIAYAGTFLPKHRVGNLGYHTEYFVRVRPGIYRLR